jgi:hypothetical protein
LQRAVVASADDKCLRWFDNKNTMCNNRRLPSADEKILFINASLIEREDLQLVVVESCVLNR